MDDFKYTRKKHWKGNHWLILIILLFAGFMTIDAQNVIQVQSTTAQAQQQCTISVTITNTQQFVGFQLDIPLHGQLTYVQNSGQLNPARSNGHSLTASIINGNVLRIIAFSFSNQAFNGTSGEVVSFQLMTGTVPGTYPLPITNGVIANSNSVNILTAAIDGSVTLLAPNIHTNSSILSFGSIPLGSHQDLQLNIENQGNQSLYISQISFNSTYFQVVGNSSFVISAGQSTNLTVRFTAQMKGVYNKTMQIFSNDPDESVINIGLLATAFAVNELHCGTIQAASGTTATLGLSINNMEPFSAFQFDLLLPEPVNYIQNSVYLNPERSNGHTVSAELINSNTLRVVGFSVTNQTFTGINGDVVHLQFGINGTGGTYGLELSNVIIADVSGQNIISAYYSNVLVITAPDISLTASLSFGEVSILSSSSATIEISNFGAEALNIGSFDFNNPDFSSPTEFPVTIQPWEIGSFQLNFNPSNVGVTQGLLHIFSNDPDENPFQVNLNANVYAPNYMTIPPNGATQTDTTYIDVSIQNYDPFIAFECEIHFDPNVMDFLESGGFSYLTERATDHVLYVNEISPGIIKLISFSLQQNTFTGNQGTVARIGFAVSAPTIGVNYPINLANGILADPQGNNVLYATQDGSLTIVQEVVCPEDIFLCLNNDGVLLSNGQPAGGLFSGNGVIDNHFYPDLAGVGTHSIIYAYTWDQGFTHECTFFATVFTLPEVGLAAYPDICENDEAFQLYGGVPSGGYYYGNGVSSGAMFDPSIAGVGITPVFYVFADINGCSDTAFSSITVNSAPNVSLLLTDHACIDSPPFELDGGTPEGGSYSGNGVIEGIFYPEIAGIGAHEISYTYTNSMNCTGVATSIIEIHELPFVELSDFDAVCANTPDFPLTGGSPSGGVYSGTGVTGNGYFSPQLAGEGIHEIFYTYTDQYGCSASTYSFITVNPTPEVNINPIESVCFNSNPFELTVGSPAGGSYSGNGVTVDGWFNPSLSGAGTFIIIYSYTDQNGCTASAATEITVHPTPIVTLDAFEEVCTNSEPFTLTGGFPEGGIYSGEGVDENGVFHPETTGQGTFIIQYTFTDENGCTAFNSKPIVVNPLVEAQIQIETDENNVCEGNSITISISEIYNPGEQPQFEWFVNEQSTGNYLPEFTYIPQDGDEVNCKMTSSAYCLEENPVISNLIVINVNPLPDVTLNLEHDIICIYWDPIELIGGEPIGGVYSGAGVDGSVFDPEIAGIGIHTIIYTYEDENGCQNQAIDQIQVDLCSSLDQNSDAEKIQIFPNPTNGTFKLVLDEAYEYDLLLEIYGVNGEIIQKVILDKGQKSYELEIDGASAGVYILHIQHKTFNIYRKLILK